MYMTYKKANGEAHKRLSVWPSLVHVWNTALWQFQWKLGLTIWGSMPPEDSLSIASTHICLERIKR